MMVASESTIVIGCGTGRCGTKSLARLIEGCQDAVFSHERRPLLPWRFDEARFQERVRQLSSHSTSIVGDVAYSYLPYLDRFIERIPHLKVICMERRRHEVIESYMAKTPWQHHWCDHDGTDWVKDDLWDPTYPKYNVVDKALAIGMYWDEYYQEIRRIAKRYPANVQIFDVDIFNSQEGQARIFAFLGIPESHRRYSLDHRYNVKPKEKATMTPAELRRWTLDLRQCAQEVAAIVPPGEAFILVDQEAFGALCPAGRRVVPFLEKDGQYWGLPAHSQSAMDELERLRRGGATFIVFAWPAFWWLNYYTAFQAFLRTTFPCVLQNERLIVFNLSQLGKDDVVDVSVLGQVV